MYMMTVLRIETNTNWINFGSKKVTDSDLITMQIVKGQLRKGIMKLGYFIKAAIQLTFRCKNTLPK